VFGRVTARAADDRDLLGRLSRRQGQPWLADEDHINPLPNEVIEDVLELVGGGVGANVEDDRLSGNITEVAKPTRESVLPARFNRLVGEAHQADDRELASSLGAPGARRGEEGACETEERAPVDHSIT